MSTRRGFTLSFATFALLGLALPACGADTGGVFQGEAGSTSGTPTSSASTGTGGAGGQGGQAAGTGGQASGTGGQGGGQTGAENCLDGVDNDKDGDVDCADADCNAGFACEEAPSGWEFVFKEDLPADTQPPLAPCADGSAAEELFIGPAGPAECAACTCGPIEGAACSFPKLTCSPGSTGCGGTGADWTAGAQSAACAKPANLLGLNFQLSCRMAEAPGVAQEGTCAPSVSDFSNKGSFSGALRVCATSAGGGCGQGAACVPKAPEPNLSLCIRRDGEEACPAGFTATTAYKSADDSRGCSACTCAPKTTCEGASYRFFDPDNCTTGAGLDNPIDVNNTTCRNISPLLDSNSWSVQANAPKPGGSCDPAGGAPTGQVDAQGAVTFCCK